MVKAMPWNLVLSDLRDVRLKVSVNGRAVDINQQQVLQIQSSSGAWVVNQATSLAFNAACWTAGVALGVVAASAGNHAQGVAYSAQHFGIKAVIIIPFGYFGHIHFRFKYEPYMAAKAGAVNYLLENKSRNSSFFTVRVTKVAAR